MATEVREADLYVHYGGPIAGDGYRGAHQLKTLVADNWVWRGPGGENDKHECPGAPHSLPRLFFGVPVRATDPYPSLPEGTN